jgi:hypothetical protein
MKISVLLCLLALPAFALDRDGKVIPSAKQKLSVLYEWVADDPTGEAYVHTAILQRGQRLPWSFSARGRAMVFSWSPDAHYLLIGIVKPEKDMSLYCLDVNADHPKEHNLDLEAIDKRVNKELPDRNPDHGESVGFASHHQVDFEHVEWLSNGQCRLHYVTQFDRKSGEATLELDLTASPPKLAIEKITPRGPK